MSKFGEPLEYTDEVDDHNERDLETAGAYILASTDIRDKDKYFERIVDCVNALAGIEDPQSFIDSLEGIIDPGAYIKELEKIVLEFGPEYKIKLEGMREDD